MPNNTNMAAAGMILIYWSGYVMAKAQRMGGFAAAMLLLLAGSMIVLIRLSR